MIGQFKLLLAGGLLAAMSGLPATGTDLRTQDPAVASNAGAGSADRQEVRWNFAVLQFVPENGTERVEIPARNLAKVWILTRPNGEILLEILYENRDYSMISVREFHILRRSSSLASVDIPIVKGTIADMGFPLFK